VGDEVSRGAKVGHVIAAAFALVTAVNVGEYVAEDTGLALACGSGYRLHEALGWGLVFGLIVLVLAHPIITFALVFEPVGWLEVYLLPDWGSPVRIRPLRPTKINYLGPIRFALETLKGNDPGNSGPDYAPHPRGHCRA
jgi:hypothetical protein